MAFITPRSEMNKLRRLIAEEFPPNKVDDVYALVEPFTEKSTRLATCIVYLARGDLSMAEYYTKCAYEDYRDVIMWAENPRESSLNSSAKVEDYQKTLQWLGLPRDTELDDDLERSHPQQPLISCDLSHRRPWWRFW